MNRFISHWAIAVATILTNCSPQKGLERITSYPLPLPDSVALPFLPGVVSSDSLDFGAAFSPDGKSFYFARSTPSRNGWSIRISKFDGCNWTHPVVASHVEPIYSAADPFITSDGSIYFISNRPRDSADTIPDYDIWVVRPLDDGGWSPPENLSVINTDSAEYYVSIATNGNLYFASDRAAGYGSHDIYVSKLENGKYAPPQNLGPSINSEAMEHDPLILAGETILIFTAVNRRDGFGEADLYYSVRQKDEKWSKAINLGKGINTPTYEYCPNISPNLKYFFFSSEYEVKWIDATALPFKLPVTRTQRDL